MYALHSEFKKMEREIKQVVKEIKQR